MLKLKNKGGQDDKAKNAVARACGKSARSIKAV